MFTVAYHEPGEPSPNSHNTDVSDMFLGVTSVLFLSGCQIKIFDIFFSSVPAAYLTHLILHTFMIHISLINSFVISFVLNFTSLAPVPH